MIHEKRICRLYHYQGSGWIFMIDLLPILLNTMTRISGAIITTAMTSTITSTFMTTTITTTSTTNTTNPVATNTSTPDTCSIGH